MIKQLFINYMSTQKQLNLMNSVTKTSHREMDIFKRVYKALPRNNRDDFARLTRRYVEYGYNISDAIGKSLTDIIRKLK